MTLRGITIILGSRIWWNAVVNSLMRVMLNIHMATDRLTVKRSTQ